MSEVQPLYIVADSPKRDLESALSGTVMPIVVGMKTVSYCVYRCQIIIIIIIIITVDLYSAFL